MPKLIAIAIRSGNKRPMETLPFASVSMARGVATDSRGKPGKRQVTVLSQKAWTDTCDELKVKLDWTVRRANLLVDDLDLCQSMGKTIVIGRVRLLITGETDPCARMEKAHKGLLDALLSQWRGGVCCQVLEGGELILNSKVELLE